MTAEIVDKFCSRLATVSCKSYTNLIHKPETTAEAECNDFR